MAMFSTLSAPRAGRPLAAGALAVGLSLASVGCVDALRGSNIQVDFGSGVQTPAPAGQAPAPQQPGTDSYYSFYSINEVYQVDGDGNVVLDDDGNPTVVQSFLFEVQRFEVLPLINLSSPCFIDVEGARFPGVHVTQFLRKVQEATGITDPYTAPEGTDPGDITDVLDAQVRDGHLGDLATKVKAVVGYSEFPGYPAPGTDCVADGGPTDVIPPITCIDDQSNDVRLAQCEALWKQDEHFYEGSDKVFTQPINGTWYGAVVGMNPINGGFLAGSSFIVDEVLDDFAKFEVHWQFKDRNGDGQPDYPTDFPQERKSPTGVVYLRGDPVRVTRGTINVSMENPVFSNISAEVAIFPGIGDDDVHF